MNYTIHNLVQGSPEWHAHRATCYNASDLSAAFGSSSYKSRTDLIRQMASGIEQEIDAATQRRFDDGHRFEALARKLAEKIIGRDLYPITASVEVDGLARRLSASLDGATDDDSTNFEHKSLNANLSASLDREIIPEEYWPQMEQGMLINGAGRTLFMASKWDENDNLIEEKHCWYESRPELRAKIVPTWRQIEEDLANYQHVEVAPAVVVQEIDDLPALTVELVGSVTATNMVAWKGAIAERIKAINTDLKTDEDFAIAEKTVKFLDHSEKKLEMVKAQALSQTASIDELFRTIDSLAAEMKAKRLNLDKLVKSRKESIRVEIMQDAQAKLAEHVKNLNERIGWFNGVPIISPAAADFATAIKGKKTVASLRDACDTELASAKIATSAIADRIEANRKAMGDNAALFPDFPHVCTKERTDFANLIAVRVQQQKDAEAKREAERAEAERKAHQHSVESGAVKVEHIPVHSMIDDGTRIKLGDINLRLSPLAVTADMLAALGFQPASKEGAAKLYKASDWTAICAAIVRHVQAASTNQLRKAA